MRKAQKMCEGLRISKTQRFGSILDGEISKYRRAEFSQKRKEPLQCEINWEFRSCLPTESVVWTSKGIKSSVAPWARAPNDTTESGTSWRIVLGRQIQEWYLRYHVCALIIPVSATEMCAQ